MSYALSFLKNLEGIRSTFLDSFVQLVTRLGEEVIVLGVICILYWCINKESAYRLGFGFFLSGIAVQALKVSFRIERPWVLDKSLTPVSSARPAATGYSFPSGHTQSATSLYGYIAATVDKRCRWGKIIFAIMLLLIGAVGFSRMYLGVHTYFDVVASILVTALSLFAIIKLWDIISMPENTLTVSVILGTVSVLLCVYSYILYKIGLVPLEQITDCFKSGGAGLGFAIGYYAERKYLNFSVSTEKLWHQLIKAALGIVGALVIKSLPKLIAEGNLAVDFSRYLITVLWVIVIFPIIFKRFTKEKNGSLTKSF